MQSSEATRPHPLADSATADLTIVLSTSRRRLLARADPRTWPIPLVAAIPPALIALALYVRTLMPGLGLWDTAEFQAIGPVLGIAHPTGYPTYTLLAWLASVVFQPLGDEAWRANLLSALLVAGAVGLAAGTVTMLSRRVMPGIAAGLALAVAAQTWRVALSADPHALHLFFVALLLALLVNWMIRLRRDQAADLWLFAAAVVYGLSLGNHALTILLAPGIALFVFGIAPSLLRRPKFVLACAAAVILVTVEVYAYLPIRSAMDPPLDYANPQAWENVGLNGEVTGGFSYLVFGEQFRGTFGAMPPDAISRVIDWNVASVGIFALLAVAGGLFLLLRRPGLLVLLVTWFAVTWYFSLTYINAAIERYYLGPLLVVVVLGGLGAAGLIDLATRADVVGRFGARGLNRLIIGGLAGLILLVPVLVSAPGTLRDVDQSHNRDGRRWVESVLPRLEDDAVVVSWWSFSTALWYAQYVEGRRQDVYVVDDRTMLDENLGSAADVLDRYVGRRPLYLIRLDGDLPFYRERYQLEAVPDVLPMWGGEVYRVIGRTSSARAAD